ncbi:hypothetical protein DPMN_020664 [Dreissena polymorpha]|uniref:Uncharacterized protein n=1 Tax=Dreissena polymorpha TaxID=45954 RepID=A0A9D4NMY3_DREPO|nr:hypothetical protein DPMN_020664 [Dreissena polymorpha]
MRIDSASYREACLDGQMRSIAAKCNVRLHTDAASTADSALTCCALTPWIAKRELAEQASDEHLPLPDSESLPFLHWPEASGANVMVLTPSTTYSTAKAEQTYFTIHGSKVKRVDAASVVEAASVCGGKSHFAAKLRICPPRHAAIRDMMPSRCAS